jgi:hypothetical protein
LEIGGAAQACYERLRTSFLAGAWEGSPDSVRFARDGVVSLLALDQPTWTVEICQAAPPAWQGAHDPYQAVLRDVVRWLLRSRSSQAITEVVS